ncbi:MAG: hypothetical protein QM820_49585 [Minicystis sp.]
MSILPARPLRVARSYAVQSYRWSAVAALVAMALAGLFFTFSAQGVKRIFRDRDLWENGVPTRSSHVSVRTERGLAIIANHTLNVEYVDQRGTAREQVVEFSTLFVGLPGGRSAVVRHDPRAPERIAVSLAMDAMVWRWMDAVLWIFIGLIVGSLPAYGAWALYDRVRLARLVAEDGMEVACEVTHVDDRPDSNGRPSPIRTFHFQVPAMAPGPLVATGGYRDAARPSSAGHPSYGDRVMIDRKDGTPLMIGVKEKRDMMLVLVSPRMPHKAQVIRHDLHPFELTEAERAEVQRRVAEARASRAG